MGLQSALSTALTGMNAAETTIDVVGNNVANSNTVGFKESEAVFATQFLQTQSLGSSPTSTTGGTNPRQIGLGVQVAQITPDFTQGTVEISANPLDMAIQGDGFFVVQGSNGEQLYTRNGQFSTNSDNQLVTINGQRVLGFGVNEDFVIQETSLEPITIPLGSAAVAQATQNVFLEGTLIPTADIGDTPGVIQSAILSTAAFEIPTNLTSSDIASVAPPNVSTSTVAASPAAGTIGAGTYSYRTVFVDPDGNRTAPSSAFGPIVTTGVAGVDQAITVGGLPSIGAPYNAMEVYRSLNGGDYQLVTTRPAGSPSSFTDTAAQGSLGATLNDDALNSGNYSYYVTFFDSAGGTLESRPTALIGPVSIGSDGQRIRLENIPQPTPGGDFDTVRIYRNTATDSSTFYRVAQLSGGETSFIDGQPDADIAVDGNEISLEGPAIGFSTLLTDVVSRDGATYTDLFEIGTLSFTGKKGGRALATKEFEITATSTVQGLMQFMNEAMGIQEQPGPDAFNPIPGSPGESITADSRIQFTSNMGVQNALEIGLSSFSLSIDGAPPEPISLPFVSSQTANGEGTATDFVVFDSLGIPLSVRVTTVLESKTSTGTTYRWYAESPDNDPIVGVDTSVGTGVMTFDGEGNLVSVSESTVSIDRRDVASASPLEFELDFSQISGLAEEQSNVNATRQDGSGAGTLSSFIISETGRIVGVFSNGISRDLGQIRLARFANNSGLEQIGENLFARGVNSGLPIGGEPGANGIGSITAGAVELSNTDIGQNLIELILASTQYRGGARVITAVQQLLDELMALRR